MSILESLRGGLIVSCQAPADSPLHAPDIVTAIAFACIRRGAVGIRVDTPAHVSAVRALGPIPIIGLWKRHFPGSDVYITPRYEEAAAIAEAGADIVAIDATLRNRPDGETVSALIERIHTEQKKLVMADVDTLASAIAAVEAGADLVGTTLYGYTAHTQHLSPPGFDLLSELVKLNTPAICEGGIASPEMAQQALEMGAYAVVVGTAITGIDLTVEAFQAVFKEARSKALS